MPHRITLSLMVMLVFICAACNKKPLTIPTNTKQPNVILVITDDQGYGDLAAHGHPFIKTPALDQLHKESLRLTDFHVDPTCSPTRSALMTGRYSGRVGVWHTVLGRSLLRREEKTMADVFKNNGYATAMFGKWHLGDNFPYRPQDRGFDTVTWHKGGGVGQGPDYFGNDYFDDTYFVKDKTKKFKGYCTDIWFDEAMNFIESNKSKPFFCYLATNAPHGPMIVANKYSDPYKGQEKVNERRLQHKFLGMITNFDENMARLDKKLKELNLVDNTILIFMTDNGSAAGSHIFNDGMRGAKGSYYDGGHRVPFFIRWPAGKLPVNRDINTLSAHVDVLPTLIDMCGLKKTDVAYDGSSLQKTLYGQADDKILNRSLVVESQRIYNPVKYRRCQVMRGSMRLSMNMDNVELYDISNDRGQQNDIADKHPELVKSMKAEYEKFWESLASFSHKQSAHISIGAPEENPTTLMSHDKLAPSSKAAWGQHSVKSAYRVQESYWSVEVEHEGTYTFEVRRWPKETDQTMNAKHTGRAIKVNSVDLKIGSFSQNKKVNNNTKEVTFTTTLKKGVHQLVADFNCDDGVYGAYYVYVTRVTK